MYPLKFEPILKQTLWGGDKIIPFKHLNDTLANVGESWEVSAVEGSESIVANGADKGLTLPDMVRKYKEDLVGEANYARFGNKFPLLIKFIDAKLDLSIQVHPGDELAKKRHSSFGKNEMWYVVAVLQSRLLRKNIRNGCIMVRLRMSCRLVPSNRAMCFMCLQAVCTESVRELL